MGGRAILADEVGLGKTIEASIIYKELAIRGLARRALILTPASLVGQWQGELEEKFFERFETPTDPDDWQRVTKAIISHDRARSRRHAEEILRHRWDLVIVDEAHKVKSHRGATYQFIERIERDFILLLTATPLQNDLRELYNLITLLRPGQLGTWQEFKSEHLVSGDHRQPRDPEALRALTHEVMIRTRRSSVVDDLALPPRRPRHPEVKLTRAEADLYERTTAFLRRLYREGFIQPAEQEEVEDEPRRRKPTKKGILQLAVIHLRQRLCSSSRALAESLAHLAESERISPEYRALAQQLAKRAEGIKTHAKLDVLTKLLKETPDRLVVFFRSSPDHSADRRARQETGPAADRLLGCPLDGRSGQAHPRLPRRHTQRPNRHPCRERRTKPPVLQCARELRPPLEPDGGGAAHRTAAPHRAEARGPHREPRRGGDDRVIHPPAAGPEDQAVRAGGGRAGPDPRRVRRRAAVRGPAGRRVARR